MNLKYSRIPYDSIKLHYKDFERSWDSIFWNIEYWTGTNLKYFWFVEIWRFYCYSFEVVATFQNDIQRIPDYKIPRILRLHLILSSYSPVFLRLLRNPLNFKFLSSNFLNFSNFLFLRSHSIFALSEFCAETARTRVKALGLGLTRPDSCFRVWIA